MNCGIFFPFLYKSLFCGFHFSTKAYFVGTHWKCLTKTLLIGTHNIHFYGEIEKLTTELSNIPLLPSPLKAYYIFHTKHLIYRQIIHMMDG